MIEVKLDRSLDPERLLALVMSSPPMKKTRSSSRVASPAPKKAETPTRTRTPRTPAKNTPSKKATPSKKPKIEAKATPKSAPTTPKRRKKKVVESTSEESEEDPEDDEEKENAAPAAKVKSGFCVTFAGDETVEVMKDTAMAKRKTLLAPIIDDKNEEDEQDEALTVSERDINAM